MISRRALVGGAVCLCCTAQAAVSTRRICISFQADPGSAQQKFPGLRVINFYEGFGFENAIVGVLAQLSDLFGVKAGFGFYDDDPRNPNAGATSDDLLKGAGGWPTSDGTVALGRHLVQQIRSEFSNVGAAISAVCAHEYGHILQFKYVVKDLMKLMELDDGQVRSELHADFICGYYAYFRKSEQPNYPAAIQATTQYRYGGEGYTKISHGTRKQRGDAVYAGFLEGKDGRKDSVEITKRGLEFVLKMRL